MFGFSQVEMSAADKFQGYLSLGKTLRWKKMFISSHSRKPTEAEIEKQFEEKFALWWQIH